MLCYTLIYLRYMYLYENIKHGGGVTLYVTGIHTGKCILTLTRRREVRSQMFSLCRVIKNKSLRYYCKFIIQTTTSMLDCNSHDDVAAILNEIDTTTLITLVSQLRYAREYAH